MPDTGLINGMTPQQIADKWKSFTTDAQRAGFIGGAFGAKNLQALQRQGLVTSAQTNALDANYSGYAGYDPASGATWQSNQGGEATQQTRTSGPGAAGTGTNIYGTNAMAGQGGPSGPLTGVPSAPEPAAGAAPKSSQITPPPTAQTLPPGQGTMGGIVNSAAGGSAGGSITPLGSDNLGPGTIGSAPPGAGGSAGGTMGPAPTGSGGTSTVAGGLQVPANAPPPVNGTLPGAATAGPVAPNAAAVNPTATPVTGSVQTTGEAAGTVQGQLNNILTSGNPLLEAAKARAAQAANARGLQNSSMAAQAGEEAIVNTALPIAQQDAATFQNQQLVNQEVENKFLGMKYGADLDLRTAYENYKQQNALFDKDAAVKKYITDTTLSAQERMNFLDNAARIQAANIGAESNKYSVDANTANAIRAEQGTNTRFAATLEFNRSQLDAQVIQTWANQIAAIQQSTLDPAGKQAAIDLLTTHYIGSGVAPQPNSPASNLISASGLPGYGQVTPPPAATPPPAETPPGGGIVNDVSAGP